MLKTIMGLVSGGVSGISTYLIIGALALSLGAYGGYKITKDSYAASQVKMLVENQKKYDAEVKVAEAAQAAAQQQKDLNDQNAAKVHDQITKVITRTVYNNVCFDTDGLRLANNAITGTAPDTSAANAALPPTQPTK